MLSINQSLVLAATISILTAANSLLPAYSSGVVFNVKNYGAKGDGTTDDQVALQKVFDLAGKLPLSIVEFPNGNYLHSGQLSVGSSVSNGEMRIQGEPTARLTGTNAAAQSVILNGSKVDVEGLEFVGKQGGDPAVLSGTINSIILGGNTFIGFTDCVRIQGVNSNNILGNSFYPQPSGIGLSVSDSANTAVTNNTFNGVSFTASQQGFLCSNSTNTSLTDNVFTKLNIGFSGKDVESLTIKGSSVSNCSTAFMFNGAISTNLISNSVRDTPTFAGANTSSINGFTADSNTIRNCQTVFNGFQGTKGVTISNNNCTNFRVFINTRNNVDMKVLTNQISKGLVEFVNAGLDTDFVMNGNSITDCTAPINFSNENTLTIDSNFLSNTGAGINTSQSANVLITGNVVNQVPIQGIVVFGSKNAEISKNKLSNCGLSPSIKAPQAVIYSDGTGSMTIIDNSYFGNAANLKYFIDTDVASAEVIGNTTNTMLPNKIGP